jgi:AraC family transcriptional regulator
MAVELAIRQWARTDQAPAAAVEKVDAARLKISGSLYRKLGLSAPDAEARYQAGFFFEGEIPAMGTEVQQVTIPGGRWVVSMHQGSYETLWQSWNQLYRDWLPTSGFHPRDAIPFEVYCSNPKHTPAEKLRTEIWIPIL